MVTASNACHRVSPFDVVSALPQDCEFVCSSLLGWKFALAKGEDWNCCPLINSCTSGLAYGEMEFSAAVDSSGSATPIPSLVF